MQKKIIFLLGLFFCVLFILQALTGIEFIPLSWVSIILGVDSSSPFNFFVFPFLYFILKFVCIAAKQIFGLKFFPSLQNPLKPASEFFGFLFDFFVWVISFWLVGMLVFFLIITNSIPNKNPPLFFISLNLFIGFFILLKSIRFALPSFEQIVNASKNKVIK